MCWVGRLLGECLFKKNLLSCSRVVSFSGRLFFGFLLFTYDPTGGVYSIENLRLEPESTEFECTNVAGY